MSSRVTVITTTTGRKELLRCISSVKNQTYKNIQHLCIIDGMEAEGNILTLGIGNHCEDEYSLDFIPVPYQIGNLRWNGHRGFGAGTFLADENSAYVMFLDDDNYLDPDHIENCVKTIESGTKQWSYSLRKIMTLDGTFLCNDDCESLGKWASVIHYQDFFIDVNCYFLPRMIAVQMSPIWYCKFREPGQPEIDRKIAAYLMNTYPNYDCTYKYSVNYAVASNSQLSVKPEFFENGNAMMLRRYGGVLPWVK